MPGPLVLDTGPFVALVHRGDRRHRACVETLRGWEGSIVTTEAVLTETMYLVGASRAAQHACLEFILRGVFVLLPATPESLRRVAALMDKYKDIPMDFADATLVALAEDVQSDRVFTLDRRGFTIYRTSRGRPFQILP